MHSTHCTVHESGDGPYTFFFRFELRQSKKGTEVSSITQEIHSIPYFMHKDDILLLQFFTWFYVHMSEVQLTNSVYDDPLVENPLIKC